MPYPVARSGSPTFQERSNMQGGNFVQNLNLAEILGRVRPDPTPFAPEVRLGAPVDPQSEYAILPGPYAGGVQPAGGRRMTPEEFAAGLPPPAQGPQPPTRPATAQDMQGMFGFQPRSRMQDWLQSLQGMFGGQQRRMTPEQLGQVLGGQQS